MNKLTSSFRDLVADAEKEIETLSPAQVRAALDSSTGGLLLVDLRDVREVKSMVNFLALRPFLAIGAF